jgi:hypothetical protein
MLTLSDSQRRAGAEGYRACPICHMKMKRKLMRKGALLKETFKGDEMDCL